MRLYTFCRTRVEYRLFLSGWHSWLSQLNLILNSGYLPAQLPDSLLRMIAHRHSNRKPSIHQPTKTRRPYLDYYPPIFICYRLLGTHSSLPCASALLIFNSSVCSHRGIHVSHGTQVCYPRAVQLFKNLSIVSVLSGYGQPWRTMKACPCQSLPPIPKVIDVSCPRRPSFVGQWIMSQRESEMRYTLYGVQILAKQAKAPKWLVADPGPDHARPRDQACSLSNQVLDTIPAHPDLVSSAAIMQLQPIIGAGSEAHLLWSIQPRVGDNLLSHLYFIASSLRSIRSTAPKRLEIRDVGAGKLRFQR